MRAIPIGLLLLTACVPPPRDGRAVEPFTCHGADGPTADRDEPAISIDARAAVRLELTRGEDAAAEGAATARLSLVADDAPLGTIAIALSEAVGTDVMLDPEMVGRRVTVRVRDVGMDRLCAVLATAAGAMYGNSDGAIHFMTPWRARERADRAISAVATTVLETRIVDIRGSAADIAATFCETIASPRGSASIVDGALVVRDAPAALERLDELVRAIETR